MPRVDKICDGEPEVRLRRAPPSPPPDRRPDRYFLERTVMSGGTSSGFTSGYTTALRTLSDGRCCRTGRDRGWTMGGGRRQRRARRRRRERPRGGRERATDVGGTREVDDLASSRRVARARSRRGPRPRDRGATIPPPRVLLRVKGFGERRIESRRRRRAPSSGGSSCAPSWPCASGAPRRGRRDARGRR